MREARSEGGLPQILTNNDVDDNAVFLFLFRVNTMSLVVVERDAAEDEANKLLFKLSRQIMYGIFRQRVRTHRAAKYTGYYGAP